MSSVVILTEMFLSKLSSISHNADAQLAAGHHQWYVMLPQQERICSLYPTFQFEGFY